MNSTIRYIIVGDSETGGLPNKDKQAFYDIALCESAFVVIDIQEMKVVEEWSTLFRPYKDNLEYNPKALEVNGLTVEQLQESGDDLKNIYKEMVTLFKKYKNPRIGAVLAGHNFQPFDMPFLINMFEFCGDNIWNYVTFVEDTMKLAWYRATEQENYKLGTCCRMEGVDLVDAHRALADTKANALLLLKYISYLRGSGEGLDVAAPRMKPSSFRETFQLV